jgi:hypothetical protein
VSAVQSWADVEDLSSIEDHIDAMLTATTSIRRIAVLGSAQAHYLGGIRLVCLRHPGGSMSFAELRRHAAKVAHEPGDVTVAPDDPRELGRSSERCDDR